MSDTQDQARELGKKMLANPDKYSEAEIQEVLDMVGPAPRNITGESGSVLAPELGSTEKPWQDLAVTAEAYAPAKRVPRSFASGIGHQDPLLASASKDPKFYAPPEFMPSTKGTDTLGGALTTARNALVTPWIEPSEEEFSRDVPGAATMTPADRAAAYQQYSDARYKDDFTKAVAEGRPINRTAFSGGEGWKGTAQNLLGHARANAESFFRNIPFLGTASETAARGLGVETQQEQDDLRARTPVGNYAGQATLLAPSHPYNQIMQFAAPAAPAATGLGRIAQVGDQAAAAGALVTGGEAVTGGRVPTVPELFKGAALGMGTGVVGGVLGEGLASRQKAFREATPDLVNAERAGFGKTSVIHGMAPTSEMKGLIDKAHALNASENVARSIGPEGQYGGRFGEVESARAGETRGNLFNSPAGQVALPAEQQLADAQAARSKLIASDGRPLVGAEPHIAKIDKIIEGLRTKVELVSLPELHQRFNAVVDHAGNPLPGKEEEAAYLKNKIAEVYDVISVPSNDPMVAGNESDPVRAARIIRQQQEGRVVQTSADDAAKAGFPKGRSVAHVRDQLPGEGPNVSMDPESFRVVRREGGQVSEGKQPPVRTKASLDETNPNAGKVAKNGKEPITPFEQDKTVASPAGFAPGTGGEVVDNAHPDLPENKFAVPDRFVLATPKADVAQLGGEPRPMNAHDLDSNIHLLDDIKKNWKGSGEPFKGFNELDASLRKLRDQFEGGPGMPQGPGGWSKFESNEEQRIAGKEGMFRLAQQARPHFFGTHLNPTNSSNVLALKLRLDPLYSGLRGAFSRSGGPAAQLASDEEKRKLRLQLQGPLGEP